MHRLKCIVAGEAAVGKTSVIQALESQVGHAVKSYNMGLGLKLSIVAIGVPDQQIKVEFYFYDSSGKDVFKDVLIKYWVDAQWVVLVFDVTDESTLSSCLKWSEILKNTERTSHKGLLIANKIDKAERRTVSTEHGQQMAEKLGLQYFECSAKTNVGIDEAFRMLAKACHE
ncbi:Intraflagellar transport protein 27 [Chamberlinius hualienensis]